MMKYHHDPVNVDSLSVPAVLLLSNPEILSGGVSNWGPGTLRGRGGVFRGVREKD